MLIPMITTAPFEWQGRAFGLRERFDAKPIEAAMLTYRQKARFATPEDWQDEPRAAPIVVQASVDVPEPEQPPKRRRGRPRRSVKE